MNNKCSSILIYSAPPHFPIWGTHCYQFLLYHPGYSMHIKMDNSMMHSCISLFFFWNFTYIGEWIGHILNKKRCKCGNTGLHLQRNPAKIQRRHTASSKSPEICHSTFIYHPIFGLCSWHTSFLPMSRTGQPLYNLRLLHFLFSLTLCPWQFVWVTPHFSGFSLNVNSSERPCIPFYL